MNIKVIKERFNPNLDKLTGGGYAVHDIEVHINSNRTEEEQREILLHEIIEVFQPSLCHEKVDELTSQLHQGLGQLR